MSETISYFTIFAVVHVLIFLVLLIPFIVFIILAVTKKKKIFFFVASIFLGLPFFVYNQRSFVGYQITKECHIKKHFLQDKYYLSDKRGKCLVDNICEWCITDGFIYGFCYNDSDMKERFFDAYIRLNVNYVALLKKDLKTTKIVFGNRRNIIRVNNEYFSIDSEKICELEKIVKKYIDVHLQTDNNGSE